MLELIKKRRSIRKYTETPVSDSDVKKLLEAAMSAPSADNSQPWEFVIVQQDGLRRQLAQTHPWSRMCAGAPLIFVVCVHERRSSHWVEDASAATENMLLAATGLGLGAVWVGVYPNSRYEEHVRRVLDIPSDLRVLCLVPVGHPAESKSPRTQYSQGKVHYDGY
jgi:nitroreductase